MLDTWRHREQYIDSAALTAALDETIRHEAGVQRRKHAALHHGDRTSTVSSHVTPLSADAAIEALLAALHATPVDHDQAKLAALAASKQHAAEHVQVVARSRSWLVPLLVVGVLGVVIIVGMRWIGANGAEAAATQALRADNARNINSTRGQRGNVTLGDGSTARIGSDSHLKLPANFGGTVRTLELNGTAMFSVAPGKATEFVVRAGNAFITATGTQFTVRAFDDDSSVVVGVDEGSVSVRAKDQRTATALAAGKSLRMARDGSVTPIDDAARALALEWVHDTLVFADAPVKVVLPELIRWFDLKAKIADPALGDRRVSMRVGLQSSGEALKVLAAAANLSVGFDTEDHVVLTDATAAPATGGAKKAAKAK
jgi:transmembrane sensor